MTVTTTGTGRVSIAPASAELTLGVAVSRPDASSAYADAAAAAGRAVGVLDGLGLQDRRTSRLTVQPRHDHNVFPAAVAGYEASTYLTVRLPPDRVADLLERVLAGAGDAVRVDHLGFVAPDDPAAVTRARAAAYAEARAAAEEYAALSGTRLGDVVKVVEGVPEGPVLLRAMSSSAAMPVAGGTSDVAVAVTVTWSLA